MKNKPNFFFDNRGFPNFFSDNAPNSIRRIIDIHSLDWFGCNTEKRFHIGASDWWFNWNKKILEGKSIQVLAKDIVITMTEEYPRKLVALEGVSPLPLPGYGDSALRNGNGSTVGQGTRNGFRDWLDHQLFQTKMFSTLNFHKLKKHFLCWSKA